MPPFGTAEKKAAAIAAIRALEQVKDPASGKIVKKGLTQIKDYRDKIEDGTYTSDPEALSESIKHLARKLKETRDDYAAGKSKQAVANATRIELWPQLLAILEEEGTNANRSYVNSKLGRGAAAAAAAAGPGGGSARGRSTRKNGSSGRGRSRSRSVAANPFNAFNEPSAAAPGGGGGGSGSKKSLSAGLIKYQANLATLKASGMSNKNARNTLRKRKENSLGSVGSAAAAASAPAGKARGRSRSASGSRRGAGGAAAAAEEEEENLLFFPPKNEEE